MADRQQWSEQQFFACFQDIVDLLNTCEVEDSNTSKPFIESMACRLEVASKFMDIVLSNVLEYVAELNEVSNYLKIIHQKWCRKLQELELRYSPNCTHLAIYTISPPDVFANPGSGRPKYNIREETLLHFRDLGFKWKDIARLLLVSRWTLWRRVRELGIAESTGFTNIEDNELDNIVRQFMNTQGSLVGYSMVCGHLREMGIKVQRNRVRRSISRVDPENTRLRWATVVSRRAYNVRGPNSLWHLDGHHSLITWGFVIHGGIDGFSRLICYLKCSTNNRSETVEQLFLEGVERYSWPSRVRTDHGGENVLVWEHMNEYRGRNRGSALAGSSTHNQRIERLWRDVFRCFGNIFYYTFQSMQEAGVLDTENLLHMFILHYVYLPRINAAINLFVTAWNKHPIRTERNWNPEQIWSNGMIDRANRGLSAIDDVRGDPQAGLQDHDLAWYGFDPDAPLPPDDGLSTVEVNDITMDLPDDVIAGLTRQINPLANSNSFGIDIFQRAVQLVQEMIINHD